MRKILLFLALGVATTGAQAQILPFLSKRGPQQPVVQGIDALRAEFAAQSGGTTV